MIGATRRKTSVLKAGVLITRRRSSSVNNSRVRIETCGTFSWTQAS
jgi:hypothetical protein